jgi:ABC-type sugar transport system ATPase subunit
VTAIIEARGVVKAFGQTPALRGVTIAVGQRPEQCLMVPVKHPRPAADDPGR